MQEIDASVVTKSTGARSQQTFMLAAVIAIGAEIVRLEDI
jgi:hypothetical protein